MITIILLHSVPSLSLLLWKAYCMSTVYASEHLAGLKHLAAMPFTGLDLHSLEYIEVPAFERF